MNRYRFGALVALLLAVYGAQLLIGQASSGPFDTPLTAATRPITSSFAPRSKMAPQALAKACRATMLRAKPLIPP